MQLKYWDGSEWKYVSQGVAGDTGVEGDTGVSDVPGDTGIQGEQGDTGTQGDQGDTGTQGDQGDTGTQGDQGDTGQDGDTGEVGPEAGTFSAFIIDPYGVYDIDTTFGVFYTNAAITITRINISLDTTGQNISGDLKHATSYTGLASAAVIDVCDTSSGTFNATSGFNDATVPASRYIYFSFDSQPNTAIKGMFLQVWYTVD